MVIHFLDDASLKKLLHPKAMKKWKYNSIWKIFHQQKIQKVLMKIDEMADVFLNSANFWQHAFSNLAPSSSYTMNLKTLTKVSKLSWASQFSYEILYSSFEWKFRKDKFHFSQKKHSSKKPASTRVKAILKP